jgi:uncharacterized protein YbjQ (UPF0145 family)
MGSCVYHVGRRGFVQTTAQMGRNVEVTNYAQALYDARELAMGRIQDEADQAEAAGMVGVEIQEHNHGWGSHTVEFVAIGTAIVKTERAAALATPAPVISLDN